MNNIIGYLPGIFDMFHNGHINIINHALNFCQSIVIGVHTDEFANEYKRKPIKTQQQRKQDILNHYVTQNIKVLFVGNSHKNIIQDNNVTHIFHGTDWELEDYKRQIRYHEDNLNVDIIMLPYTQGISTSKIIADASNYKYIKNFLFDFDKTLLLNGNATYGAIECIQLLQNKGYSIQVISNNNYYTPIQISNQLNNAGMNIHESQINSSLRQIRDYIIEHKLSRVFVWGSDNAKHYLANYSTHDINDATIIIVLFNNSFIFEELTLLLTHISNGKPYIIGNVDILYPDNNKIIPDTGTVYSIIQQTTNITPTRIFGKPFVENYVLTDIKNSYLIVGDSLTTDYVLASKLGVAFYHINDTCNMKTLYDSFALIK